MNKRAFTFTLIMLSPMLIGGIVLNLVKYTYPEAMPSSTGFIMALLTGVSLLLLYRHYRVNRIR